MNNPFGDFAGGINDLYKTYRSNPAPLRNQVKKPNIPNRLSRAIALEMVDKDISAKLRQNNLDMAVPTNSVIERLEENVANKYDSMVNRTLSTIQNQNRNRTRSMDKFFNRAAQPQRRPNPRGMLQGGIVSFDEGTGDQTVGDSAAGQEIERNQELFNELLTYLSPAQLEAFEAGGRQPSSLTLIAPEAVEAFKIDKLRNPVLTQKRSLENRRKQAQDKQDLIESNQRIREERAEKIAAYRANQAANDPERLLERQLGLGTTDLTPATGEAPATDDFDKIVNEYIGKGSFAGMSGLDALEALNKKQDVAEEGRDQRKKDKIEELAGESLGADQIIKDDLKDSARDTTGGIASGVNTVPFDRTKIDADIERAKGIQEGALEGSKNQYNSLSSEMLSTADVKKQSDLYKQAIQGVSDARTGIATGQKQAIDNLAKKRGDLSKEEIDRLQDEINRSEGRGEYRKAEALKRLRTILSSFGTGSLTASNRAANQAMLKYKEDQDTFRKEYTEAIGAEKLKEVEAQAEDAVKKGQIDANALDGLQNTLKLLQGVDQDLAKSTINILNARISLIDKLNNVDIQRAGIQAQAILEGLKVDLKQFDVQLANARNQNQLYAISGRLAGDMLRGITDLEAAASILSNDATGKAELVAAIARVRAEYDKVRTDLSRAGVPTGKL